MGNTKLLIIILALFISITTLNPQTLLALSIDDIQVVKIFPEDETALVKTPNEGQKFIKTGDLLGEHAKVTEITKDRIVIENKDKRGMETVIIRMEDGKQKMEKIRKAADKKPVLYTPKASEGTM